MRSVFPYGPEGLVETATLYDHAWGKTGAEVGLRATTQVQQPYKSVVSVLEEQGLWDDEEATRRDHTSAGEMQRVVDTAFAAREPVNLRELWEKLQQPPYGLMPSPIGILLFAFLLRPYANRYYYSDGTNSLPLNPNKLAELVHLVMKEVKGSENYTIRKMSEEGEQFCRMAAEVFQLAPDKVAFPEEARKNMRETIRGIGFPIWAVVPLSADPAPMRVAVEALQKTLGYERGDLTDRDMQAVVEAVQPVRPQQLIRMLNAERMQEGMRKFWEVQAPELLSLMKTLNLSPQHVMGRLRALLNEDVYLWTEERVKSKLPEVIREFDLVYALNMLCGTRKQELEDVRRYFRDTWFKGKLPLICFKDGQQAEIADLVDYLHRLIYREGAGLQDNRAPDIHKFSGELAALFAAGPSVLRTLVTRYMGQGFADEDAAALFAVLPDLSGATEEDARRAILERLSQQARQRKIATLEESWRQLTRSASPMDWSEQAGTPIQWVMDGSKHHDFFSGYANLRHLPDPSIEKLSLHLDEHTEELAVLNDAHHVLDRFVQVAAGDYADLVRQAEMGAQLRQHVRERMKDNVYHWPARLHEIQEHVRSRLTAGYRETAYPQVLKTLHTVAPADMKHLLRELAADPLVGARLLAMIRSRAET
ncbi:MAG TPA: hypothetical protein VLK32_02610 [Bacillota bacterium]|nr:hypothetical protein [Bacillota bacterium]